MNKDAAAAHPNAEGNLPTAHQDKNYGGLKSAPEVCSVIAELPDGTKATTSIYYPGGNDSTGATRRRAEADAVHMAGVSGWKTKVDCNQP